MSTTENNNSELLCDFKGCSSKANLELKEIDPQTRLTTRRYYRCMKHLPQSKINWEWTEGRMF